MKIRFYVLLVSLAMTVESRAAVGVRVLMGLTDTNSVAWDGSAAVQGARITKIDPWRFDAEPQSGGTSSGDAFTGPDSWKLATHRIRWFLGGQQPYVANGVILWLDGESETSELAVKTAQGNFTVRLGDIPYGTNHKLLDGRVMVDRVPPSFQITNSPEEQDYPAAAADPSGNLWLAYMEFRHNPDHDRIRQPYQKRPSNFDDMQAATGGDQILVRKFSGKAWGAPIEITPAGGDLYRPAIAVDGSGRTWVFWSENRKGNFDIWARMIEDGKPGAALQLSSEPGSDIDPVAATDAKGRVWVAWQGWRKGKASIFAATQDGNRFSPAALVASSAGNEWDPAIAVDKEGRVTVAWDSYRNGNYDIYCRTATAPGVWGTEVAVADSALYEAHPSIAYGLDGKVWIAYEEGAERWGKDFGVYETSGMPLYQGRAIRLVALDRGGKQVTTASDIGDFLPGIVTPPGASGSRDRSGRRVDEMRTQSHAPRWTSADPATMKAREPNRGSQPPLAPMNSLPRLAVDSSGRLWLTLRSAFPARWSFIGTVWTEYVVSFDGKAWTGPIYLAHSDNLLDNRPAVVATKPGELVVIGSSDGRGNFLAGLDNVLKERRAAAAERRQPISGAGMGNLPGHDPYNNDLYAARVSLTPASGAMSVKASPAGRRAGLNRMDLIEKAAIERMRNIRVNTGAGELRLVRGEFHRHSEISMDGGDDGSLLDQWRYIIDAGGMDWVGCCDHDNGGAREYSWWITQKLTDIFYTPGKFAPLFSYERSVAYPEGHRNVLFVQRGIRPLPRLPISKADAPGHAPDTQMFYAYLKQFNGVVASHTSGTAMGTDWRDNDPDVEPAVEIYQGDRQNYEMPGAPRSNSDKDSLGGWRPKGFISNALEMGYMLGFEASSDHISTHLSYASVYAADDTREAVLDGLRRRHIYGSTDNILADVRSGQYMMGDAFSTSTPPELKVKLIGTGPFAKVTIVKDGKYVYSTEPKKAAVEFNWRDNDAERGKRSYYYVRGEQENGEVVWVSPMWITYQ